MAMADLITYYMDLPPAKIRRRLDEFGEVFRVEDIAGDGDGAVRVLVIDGFGSRVGLFCEVEERHWSVNAGDK